MESTTKDQITDAEWQSALTAGLLSATPGTNAQDAAIHKFAEAIRAEGHPQMRACANGFSQHPGVCSEWCGDDRMCPRQPLIKGSMSQVPDAAIGAA